MSRKLSTSFKLPVACGLAALATLAWTPLSQARITRIIIDQTTTPISSSQLLYQQLTGRAFGELHPNDPHNALITDIAAAPRNANGKVDADGNDLGGVPTVLRDAPLGTYLGWNITDGPGSAQYDGRPFHAGQVCNYVGGMVPFFKTKAQRLAAKDPRLSLEVRYGTHDGYAAAVRKAADNAACQGYLLAGPAAAAMGAQCTMPELPASFLDDWVALVTAAMVSNVCNQPGDGVCATRGRKLISIIAFLGCNRTHAAGGR